MYTNEIMPAVDIRNLVKHYGTTTAVDDITLSVPQGAFLGFLGPNGAGKSTTINCIIGVNKITGGTINVLGHNVVDDYRSARAHIGVSSQEFNVDIFAKVWQILDYSAGYFGMPQQKRKQRIDEVLEQLNLTEHREKSFRALSGGMKRRTILARALMHDPEILILDEPTAGIDVELRRELWQHLKDLHARGKTIILTSHYLEEVEELASDLAFISNGKIVAQGSKDSFLKDGTPLEDVYLQLTQADKNA